MNYVLSFRECKRNKGGAVREGLLTSGTKERLAGESQLVFLIHGFDVSRKRGERSLSRFAETLPSAQNAGVVRTLWPGDHGLRFLAYASEGEDADETARQLAKFIEWARIKRRTPLSFVAHSLGCRVALEAAKLLLGAGYTVDQVCLLAAAVDADSLASRDDYRSCAENAGRLAVLSSRCDGVLRCLYPIGDLMQAFIYSDDQPGLALGSRGPRPHRTRPFRKVPVPDGVWHVQIPDACRVGHRGYLPSGKGNGGGGGERRSKKLRAAARFADAVIARCRAPRYERCR